jgi:RNA polymerase sigma-70 factor, ECF subfamily
LKVSWKKNREESDEELMAKYQSSGDLNQLGSLYERYMHLVYGVCLKYFREREAAQDGVTSIFEKLITELPKHEVDNFKSWLYVLTKNFCLMQIRSQKTDTKRMHDYQSDQKIFVESEQEMHPIDEEEQLLNRVLQDCIEKLKGEQQECIRLFYFESKSYKEISDALTLEEKKVKSFIQNGKRNLKICIEKNNGKKE